ncbi:MAG: hypothetical protein NWP37_05075, partial [Pontimonas sp.]|nr:hypothetical protein [Pontimonas sp.]
GAQGLSTLEAAANFIPQTVAAVAATLGLGAIVDRIDPRWGVAGSMLTLSGTLLILPLVTEGISGIIFGLLLGASMGALRGVEAAAFVRYYGRGHIGAIRGIATSIGLAQRLWVRCILRSVFRSPAPTSERASSRRFFRCWWRWGPCSLNPHQRPLLSRRDQKSGGPRDSTPAIQPTRWVANAPPPVDLSLPRISA